MINIDRGEYIRDIFLERVDEGPWKTLFETLSDFYKSNKKYSTECLFINLVDGLERKGVVSARRGIGKELIIQNVCITPIGGKILHTTATKLLNDQELHQQGLSKVIIQSIETAQFSNYLEANGWIRDSVKLADMYLEVVFY